MRANSWQDVADLSASFGIVLDPWQELILEVAMGERSDRTWAAKRVGMSVPRQNGKSQLMVARILAGALLFGEKKIVVSAHQADTAREAFAKLIEIIEDDDNDALRARLDPKFGRDGIMNAINREAVGFRNGARVQFKARTGPGGKGFSSDCLLLDEAQILGSRAWTSINSTMSAMRNPQVWLLGTPPQDEDDSYTFEMVRQSALEGKSGASAWAEWSVDTASDEYREAASDLDARKWTPAVEYLCWSANPAWGARINREVVQGEFETYPPDKFAQDRLGIWSDATGEPPVVSRADLKALAVKDAPTEGLVSYGVKFSIDGSAVALSAARRLEGDQVHVELLERRSMGAGTSWLVDWLADGESPRWRKAAQIVVDGKAHAGNFINDLRAAGVGAKTIIAPSTDQVTTAHSMFLEAVRRESVTVLDHEGQSTLLNSFNLSTRRPIGAAGGWGLQPKDGGESTSAESAIFAHWAARTSRRRPGRKQRTAVMA